MIGPKRLALRIRNVTRSTIWSVKNYYTLSVRYGQMKSMRKMMSVDAAGESVPWFTYPAIDYLNQLDLRDKRVFEYGSGASTMYFAKRCREVVSVEEDIIWYNRMKGQMPSNVKHLYAKERPDYVNAIAREEGKFDIVVNDGIWRLDCAQAARPKLADDGFVILDNSDWCVKTSKYYREECDLIEVDMSGMGPINTYVWCTSFYFTRNVRLKPAHERQPNYVPGSDVITDKDLNEWIQG
jgi:hypothetical protein